MINEQKTKPVEIINSTYSIIIPTYNRETVVIQSIKSVFSFFRANSDLFEVILVDDASTDNTEAAVRKEFYNELNSGCIKYFRLDTNIGVTGAKNFGANKASNEFYVFLDSDDELTGEIQELFNASEAIRDCGIGFFRSLSREYKTLVGEEFQSSKVLETRDYWEIFPFPECLPVIHNEIFITDCYREELRGFEGFLYIKKLFEGRKIFLSDKVLRLYREVGTDTITSQSKQKPRLRQLARGSRELAILALKNNQYRFVSRYLPRYFYYLIKSCL